jgi:replicative DNA helicase
MIGNRPSPHNEIAERGVLGSMLRDNATIGDVLQILRDEDLYSDAHQKIFRAVTDLFERGVQVDLSALASLLRERGHLEDLGGTGYVYLAELWEAEPTGVNAVHHARTVRNKAIVRRLLHAAHEIVRDTTDETGPADELLEAAESKIFAIAQLGVEGQTVSFAQMVDEMFAWIDEVHSNRDKVVNGLGTGFVDLDRKTGGLRNGELTVVAAKTGIGKTAFGLSIARHAVVKEEQHVLFVSLEQTDLELTQRIFAAEAPIDQRCLRHGFLSQDDIDRLHDAGTSLRHIPLHVDDTPNQSMLRIAANARRLKMRHGLGLVVVDYLQLVEPSNRKEPRHEQVAGISRRLKMLARELRVPVLALAQLNRNVENRTDQKPRLSDLRESGGIEMDADAVYLLHDAGAADRASANTPTPERIEIEVMVAKNRHGPTGTAVLLFEPKHMCFHNYQPDPL